LSPIAIDHRLTATKPKFLRRLVCRRGPVGISVSQLWLQRPVFSSPFGDGGEITTGCDQAATSCCAAYPHSWAAPAGAVAPGSVGAVTLKAFACARALAFYRPSIGWSKLGLVVGGRSGDAVWFRRLLRRFEPLGAHPSFHLHYDPPRSEQTRSRPSTASIEAPLHSASATQIGPLETTTQGRDLAFASPISVRTPHIANNSGHERFRTLYVYLDIGALWPLVTSPTDATPTIGTALSFSTERLCFARSVAYRTDAARSRRTCVRRASPKYLAFTVVEGTYLVMPTLHARLGVEVQHAMVFRLLRLVGNCKKINAAEAVDGIALHNPRGSIKPAS
jgi:hypothetical protein